MKNNQTQEMNLIFGSSLKTGALWLGNIKAAQNIVQLNKENIKTVITIADNNIKHKIFSIKDNTEVQIKNIFNMTNQDIQNSLQQGSVLVHCMAGISRSASCVIAYLMYVNGWNVIKAYNFTREKRSCVCPNSGFMKQLFEYERELKQIKQISIPTNNIEKANKSLRSHFKTPQQVLAETNLIRSPQKTILNLTKDSSEIEKQQYRQQMAQKSFEKLYFTTSRDDPKIKLSEHQFSSQRSIKKGQITMYQPIEENRFLTDRYMGYQ